ncbi:MAG TPA: molybdate ABC transporter substrate-binding protein [Gaiellaceae bacterium]|jgi:molybdate transport system substrate-binding protein
MRRAAALAGAALLLLPSCSHGGKLRVDAASSLTEVFQKLDPAAEFDFAGSDELAFQIEQGKKTDVYASASPKYPDRLYRAGLVERPRVFATNSLVLIVPRGNPGRVTGLGSLMRPSVKLVRGAEGVPVGDYARKILDRFCHTIFQPGGKCPRARIVSEEQDVKGVVAKVALGEADAGFVYATDVKPVAGKVSAIRLPAYLQPTVEYELAVVRGAKHREEAERFVTLVTGRRGRHALRRAGFGLP